MKMTVLRMLIIGIVVNVAQAKLPYEADTTNIKLEKIATGRSLQLNFLLAIPAGNDLNRGAPSAVGVYEKRKAEDWSLTQRFDLNRLPNEGDELHFSTPVLLRHQDSEVAVFATVYHCGKDKKTGCYIQGFQGITSRGKTKRAPASVSFSIQAQKK